jgi:uncharacterized protein YdeI (YjbR/CyaY-like superfamily)
MAKPEKYTFKAVIYKTGINFCVDVPAAVTAKLNAIKGYIRIKGTVNGFETADFVIRQDAEDLEKDYPMPGMLVELLCEKNLSDAFEALPYRRRKDILRYLNNVKSPQTLQRNINKVILQLEGKIPVDGVPISLSIKP